MAKKRLSRKELREPDKFVAWFNDALARIQPYVPRIIAGAVAVVIVLIGASVFAAYTHRRDERASALLTRASDTEQADLLPADQPAPPPPSPGSGKPDVPQFKTAPEKYQSVLDQVAAIERDYHRSGVAHDADLLAASALFHLGKYDEARARYEHYVQGAAKDDGALAVAHQGLGYCYEALGRYKDAMNEFDRIAPQDAGAFGHDRALYEHARMQEKLGDKQGALATYRQVLTITGTSLRQQAQDRIAQIEAE